jgi:hypothetical protein
VTVHIHTERDQDDDEVSRILTDTMAGIGRFLET